MDLQREVITLRFWEKIGQGADGKARRWAFLFRLFTLFVIAFLLTASTYAWISTNKHVESNHMALKVDAENATATYTFYRYDIDQGKAVVVNDLSSIELNQYDQIFQGRNKYTPVIVRIEIESVRLDATNGGTVGIVIKRNASHAQNTSYSSDVLRFSGTSKTYVITPTGDDYSAFYNAFNADHYSTIQGLSGSGDTATTVAGNVVSSWIYGAVGSTATDLELSVAYAGAAVDTSGATNKVVVFLYVTYDQSSVNTAEGGFWREIDFVDDLDAITVDVS